MSLLHPTPGDVMDRLAILSIKIPKGKKLGLDCGHLMEESIELGEWLAARGIPADEVFRNGQIGKLMDTLKQVNLDIWLAVDMAMGDYDRQTRGEGGLKAQTLNVRRQKIVREINDLLGVQTQWEKIGS